MAGIEQIWQLQSLLVNLLTNLHYEGRAAGFSTLLISEPD